MEQLLIRKIEPRFKNELKARARQHGCSMEEEARSILYQALAKKEEQVNLVDWLTKNMSGTGFTEEEVKNLRVPSPLRSPLSFDDE